MIPTCAYAHNEAKARATHVLHSQYNEFYVRLECMKHTVNS
ncbi:hypothetical protein HMPREF3232_01002 [Fannyhessea vaginae]|nr:hypothetical protein HMPREF3232_01002 [Fannyhessea vaginae]